MKRKLAKARRARSDGIGHVTRRQMTIVRVSLCPRFFATSISGTPFITAWLAQVCRRTWKFAGLIFANSQASAIGSFW
jgi:hypothetical protein